MDNKNDWKELEQWDSLRKEERKNRFGKYPEEFKKNKKIDKVTKGMDITLKIIRGIFFAIIALALLAYILYMVDKKVDVEETIENLYKVKTEIIDKNLDKNGSGTYKLETKGTDNIKFTVMKQGTMLKDDFSDNCQKYYFDLWDSPKKELFTVNETYDGEILNYETYIEVNSEDEIKEGIEALSDLTEFCGNQNFYQTWNIYLKIGEKRIYPYMQSGLSREEVFSQALEKYYEITNTNSRKGTANKVKEGLYQYLANIFLCNVGAAGALFLSEKMEKSKMIKPLTPLKKLAVILAGITATGILGGSYIANYVSKKVINPLFKEKSLNQGIYSERRPEAIDIALHADDIATAGILSGFKWIEPALPFMYFISGYRAGTGYRNNKKVAGG